MRAFFLLILCLGSLEAEDQALSATRSAFVQSLLGAPVVQAAMERLNASHLTVGAAGRLPDPMLRAGYSRRRSTMDEWPMYEVMLEQPLPRWGERQAMRAKAEAQKTRSQAEFFEVLGETAAEVANMLAEAQAAREKLALVESQIARAAALQTIVVSRVSSGTGTLAEQLGVKTLLATLTVERDTMRRMVTDAEEDIAGRLGLPTNTVLQSFFAEKDTVGQSGKQKQSVLPPFFAPELKDIWREGLPGVFVAQAKSAEAQAMFLEARSQRFPETSIGLRYERENVPGDPMRTIGVQVSISIPLWQNSTGQQEESAHALLRATRLEEKNSEFRAKTLIARAQRAQTVAASARAAALETKTRLDAEYDTLVQSASTQNGVNLSSVIEVLDRLAESQRQVIDAETTARQAAASLWRLAPPAVME